MARAISHKDHILRLAAVAAGRKTFNTGKPCKNGHSTDRYTSNGACIGCEKLRTKSSHRSRSRVKQDAAIKEAATRFNRPAFGKAVEAYQHSAEAHQRSRYLDSLLTKVPQ